MIRVWLKTDSVSQQPSTCLPYGLVWNVEECFSLRQDSRIVGAFIGTLSKAPHTGSLNGIPMLLSSEEIDLLLSLNKISLFQFKDPNCFSEDYINKFKLHQEMSYQNQVEVCKAERKNEIIQNGDKIVKGKLKKLKEDDNEIQVVDRDSILDAEIAKIPSLPRHLSLLQTFQAQPWMDYDFYQVNDWKYQGKEIKRVVFKDLWQKGFYLTDGGKFGGDYLVYPGDPMQFHAKYVVICFEDPISSMDEKDLVARSRLGTSVKKTVLLATYQDDEIKYKAFRWTEKMPKD